jgi:dinuclear metal center YbgI/SA1388 family protein
VAIYSPHTALDVADGGTNDVLADAIGLVDRAPLRIAETKSPQCKLVTFVPANEIERVSAALFDAGAGRIGNYTSCSFRSAGVGTFRGEEGASPTIGRVGQLEQVEEIRLETVVSLDRVAEVVGALRASHSYEEPAFDLVTLAAPPTGRGMGRIGTLAAATQRSELIARIKRELGLPRLLIAGPVEGMVTRVAVCAGSCGDLLDDAIAQKAELYLTGEMKHHEALRAAWAGITVVCTLHSNSERAALTRLREMLVAALPGLEVQLSTADRDPFQIL